MATHKYLMQIIYNSEGQMMDCEYVRQRDMLHQFRDRFFAEFAQARARNFSSGQGGPQTVDRASLVSNHDFRQYLEHDIVTPEMEELQYNVYEFPAGVPAAQQTIDAFGMRNLTYIPLRAVADIPAELLEQLNFQQLKQRCNVRHMQLKEIATGLRSADPEHKRIANEKLQRHKRAISDWFLSPNTKWCGKGHSASEYRQLGGASRADMCCRTHDHCKYMIPPMSTNFQTFNIRPFTISHCACDSRQRRDLSSMMRVPGTKWCGKGWSARNYVDMGGYSKADRCCRQHDLSCPFWILGFETKYNLFNWRVGTLMHCGCDERFRTCLKLADSKDANLVGKLFFNVMQMKCFVFKPETVCTKKSWWGTCERKGRRKRAVLRHNRKF
uniref:phospholipase A2 n=2 Tax=gambiae species complex TaxID=44542 RepID=A0A8W7Q0H4_ANOCL